MSALLSVENLSVGFRQDGLDILAVDDVSFSLGKGETLALVGESGSGKSVTALSILRLLAYPPAHHPSGAIWFKNQNLLTLKEEQLRQIRGRDIAMVFQEPMTSLNPLHRVERQISEVLTIHQGMSEKKARSKTLELLEMVGMLDKERKLRQFPHELSGGQRQRVMIAMALANKPSLLIADEPTTAVDVTVQAQILQLLAELKHQSDMSMLFITHDLAVVRRIADKVCVMHNGKIVESGTCDKIFRHPEHPYTKMLLNAQPKGSPPTVRNDRPALLSCQGLSVWYPLKKRLFRKTVEYLRAVDDVTFSLREGQTLAVVGESGSGKTTLGLAVTRMIRSTGAISFQGRAIDKLNYAQMRHLRGAMQIVFQDPFGALSPRMTVSDIIAEGLTIHQPKLSNKQRERKVADILEEVGLDSAARFRYPHEFSGGQRQRIAIARVMILRPAFVMLDEPTSALDVSVQAQVIELLRHLQDKHALSYLFISHDLRVVKAVANDILVLKEGRVVEYGASEEIFARPKSDYTRALLAAAFELRMPAK